MEASSDMSGFEDSRQVSAFAAKGVAWAVSEKLIQGDNGMINPQGDTNRAMCAAITVSYTHLDVYKRQTGETVNSIMVCWIISVYMAVR